MHFKNKVAALPNTGLLLLICKQSQLASVWMGQSSWISTFSYNFPDETSFRDQ